MWGAVRPPADPRLKGAAWKRTREHWRREGKRSGLGCWRCGVSLRYDEWFIPGTRKVWPNAFTLGHVIGRDEGAAIGYTAEQIDSIGNTRPDCNRCSGRSGYLYQGAKRRTIASRQLASTSVSRTTRTQGTQLTTPYVKQAAAASRW